MNAPVEGSKLTPVLVALICAKCGTEYDATFPMSKSLDARELGDGSVCVGCIPCDHDLAVFSMEAKP